MENLKLTRVMHPKGMNKPYHKFERTRLNTIKKYYGLTTDIAAIRLSIAFTARNLNMGQEMARLREELAIRKAQQEGVK